MFKNICIKPNESLFPTDIGFVAEALFYYEKVILIAATDTIPLLIQKIGLETLIELLNRGNLRILLRENMLGTVSQEVGTGNIVNDVVLFTSPALTVDEILFRGIFKATDRRGYSKRAASRLNKIIESIQYENQICDYIRNDLDDERFVKQSIIGIIQELNPEIRISPSDIEYKKIKTDKGFFFSTNLNYAEINRSIPNNPDGKRISSTNLVLGIQETRGDMHLASSLNAEIATTPIQTQLMKLKFKDIYEKSSKSSQTINQFNDFILDEGHTIREAINSGSRTIDEFLKILDKADRFKAWLQKVDDDRNLIKEYHKAVTSDTWVDRLPGKSFRWAIFTGAGLALDLAGAGGVGTTIGLGLSAGDTFLLDKIVKGWKPNVFVDKELKTFIKK
jgi:hypothetical protein